MAPFSSLANYTMNKQIFIEHLGCLIRNLEKLSLEYCTNDLSKNFKFILEPSGRETSEHLTPEENGYMATWNSIADQEMTFDEVVDLLCKDRKTTMWADCHIVHADAQATVVKITFSRRFRDGSDIYYMDWGTGPFKALMRMPPDRKPGSARFDVNWHKEFDKQAKKPLSEETKKRLEEWGEKVRQRSEHTKSKEHWVNALQTVSILIGIIFGGCLIAGLYGIVHDQLTYTISPEYYTRFKFYQFDLVDEGIDANTIESPRLAVSVVGFLATWWMGVPIATIVGLFSLHSDRRFMMNVVMSTFLVIIALAFLTGLVGLCIGYMILANEPSESLTGWFIPDNLVDLKSFIAVGSMHNYSYLGGILGTLVGFAYIQWRKWIFKKGQSVESRKPGA